MLRNYLMPGFALVLLAVFASPRSLPSRAATSRLWSPDRAVSASSEEADAPRSPSD